MRVFALLAAAAAAAAAALAACSGSQRVGSPGPDPLPAAPSGQVGAAPLGTTGTVRSEPAPPPVDMVGRWMLTAPGRGQCGMNFNGTPGAREGTIAPEGGCPGKFFTSRKWILEQSGLSIRDHRGEPLAQLAMAGTRFDGQSVGGEPVTLGR